jgi:hypothetical protein
MGKRPRKTKMKRMGRPPLPDSERRSELHCVRFTTDEWRRVTTTAAAAGLPVATFIREAALRATDKKGAKP